MKGFIVLFIDGLFLGGLGACWPWQAQALCRLGRESREVRAGNWGTRFRFSGFSYRRIRLLYVFSFRTSTGKVEGRAGV